MRKLIKKSILNGLIRTLWSLFQLIFIRVKSSSHQVGISLDIQPIKYRQRPNHENEPNSHGLNQNEQFTQTKKQPNHHLSLSEMMIKSPIRQFTNKGKTFKYVNEQFEFDTDDDEQVQQQRDEEEVNEDEQDYEDDEEEEDEDEEDEDLTEENINEYEVLSNEDVESTSSNSCKKRTSDLESSDGDDCIYKYDSVSSKKLKDSGSTGGKKFFKVKTVFLILFVIISYICLNNYLIMFLFYRSSTSPQATLPKSEFNNNYNNKPPASNSFYAALSNSFLFSFFYSSNFYPAKEAASDDAKFKILIDPLDVEMTNLNLNDLVKDNRRVLLSESFFDEDDDDELENETNSQNVSNIQHRKSEKLAKLHDDGNHRADGFLGKLFDKNRQTNKNTPKTSRHRPCMLPKLNPYDGEIMQFVKREEDIKCNPKKNWIYIENATLRVSKSAIKKHGNIVCAYIPLYRGNNDFSVYEGNRIFPVMDRMPLITDFFKIDCRSKDGAIYSNIHSGIAYESSLHMRHVWNPLPRKALGYNVLMFGFDSVSRMSWIRMLPKSYEYMVKQGFIVLKGYNIVGDGTPQALLPILTGKKETELPEARRGFSNANYVDNFPWIWKDYKNAGYVTQWAEDMQSIGTFQLRMLGFRKQPVDHYMRVFYLEAERYYSRFRRLCLGSISRHKNMFNWVKEFFTIYDKKPKFSFIFHSEASHNYNNPLSLLDDDLKEFLVYLKHSGIMNNTILLFMSDHGMRISDLRQYSQGKLEERLPFFSMLMPRSFQEKYPNEMKNLRLNSRKLTTPFDIHETLKHILNFDTESDSGGGGRRKSSSSSSTSPPPRGISLLKHISANRSCEDAQIEAHWCSCLNWIDINITNTKTSSSSSTSSQSAINNNSNKNDNNKNNNNNVNGKLQNGATINNYVDDQLNDELNTAQMTNTADDQKYLINASLSSPGLNMTLKPTAPLRRQAIDYNEYRRIFASLSVYSAPVLRIANRAVDFINSLIDRDLKVFCEKIRLHSIQKLSKLDLNRRLLAFKKSKDIHGREALFDETSKNLSNLDEFFTTTSTSSPPPPPSSSSSSSLSSNQSVITAVNSSMMIMNMNKNYHLNMDSIYQISLTTWPGNATYELSFKYNRFNGQFKFNKNEISRINAYNSTSSCMLSKRPDLRQYCFCKYV